MNNVDKNLFFGVISFHLCLRTFETAEKVGEVACFVCQFASDSESFCGGGSSERRGLDEMVCTYHTAWLVTGKTPGFSWSATGLRERGGREHGPKGGAVAFPEDGWLGNGLLQSGAGV